MYTDVVKIDAKGRITIPSALRLLLNIEEGDKLILLFDEDLQKIEILSSEQNNPALCVISSSLKSILDVVSELGNDLISITCRRIDKDHGEYRCKIIVNKKALESKKTKELKCL